MKYYLTTAIDYPNGSPHLGHAYEKLLADFLSRYKKQQGNSVRYQTGTDEHGIKIYQTAKKSGLTPKQFVNKNSKEFKDFYKLLNIEYDYFIRTSDKKTHWIGVTKIWKELIKSGDLFKKKYCAKYCVGCETFKTESELENNECPLHFGKKLEIIEEENYFFKLSKYRKRLIKLIDSDKYHIQPKHAKNEILSFLKGEVKDISFSRIKSKLPWGIPVPGDKDQVIYVWADALSNYLTGIGYGTNTRNFKKYWPADVHLIGKDISRFHAVYWPAMLLSAKLSIPKKLLVHGFINDDKGRKMSKSLGNVIIPQKQVKKYGASSLRYYLLRAIPSNQDGNYSEEDLIVRHNTELANSLGNLLSRSLNLIQKSCGEIPFGKFDSKLSKEYSKVLISLNKHVENFDFHHGIADIWAFISKVNQYVDDTKPWKLSGKEKDNVLYTLAESLRLISGLIYPVIPSKAEEIAKQLGLKSVPKFKSKSIKSGTKIKRGAHLFNKYEK